MLGSIKMNAILSVRFAFKVTLFYSNIQAQDERPGIQILYIHVYQSHHPNQPAFCSTEYHLCRGSYDLGPF